MKSAIAYDNLTSEKPLQCDECPKTFNNGGSLFKHKENQLKETWFNCNNCNDKALQNASLILHKQSVNEGLKKKPENNVLVRGPLHCENKLLKSENICILFCPFQIFEALF